MDLLAAKMRDLGHKWTKTTVFNIEHGKRQMRLGEAADVLLCIGLDPGDSIGNLLIAPEEKRWSQTINLTILRQADFLSGFEDYSKRIDELKQMLSEPSTEDESKSVKSNRLMAQELVEEYEKLQPSAQKLKDTIEKIRLTTPIIYSNGEYHPLQEQEKDSDIKSQLGLIGAVPEEIDYIRKKSKGNGLDS